MNIVITGAQGRIAKALIPDLKRKFDNVYGVSRSDSSLYMGYNELLEEDFLLKQDVILHLAWSTVPKSSEQNLYQEWVEDIPLLAEILKKLYLISPLKKIQLVFFSSAGAIYGDGFSRASDENSTLAPSSMYGWAKIHAEQLVRQCALRGGCDATIIRISNLYGFSGRKKDQQGIIPYLISAALRGEEFQVWGDGTAVKDYIYYTDFLLALIYIIENSLAGVFNISAGISSSINELISVVEKVTNRSISVRYDNRQTWDNPCSVIDNTCFSKISGWVPKVDIEQGIFNMVNNLKHDLFE